VIKNKILLKVIEKINVGAVYFNLI